MSSPLTKRHIVPDLTLNDIIDQEKIRYKRKGYGLIFSFLFTLFYFFIVPSLFKEIFPSHIENPGKFEYFILIFVHTGGFIFFNMIMYVVYHLEHPFFERYKVNDRPWPWNNPEENWNEILKATVKNLAINQLIILPLITLESLITGESHFRTDIDSFPDSKEIIIQITCFMIIEDFAFYWAHRFLHWDKIYSYIHKVHHMYINSICLASEYSHPIEFITANVLTTNIGPLLFGKRTHFITQVMWIILRLGETTDGHCGYEFSWSPYRLIPFSGSSEFHNYHHLNYKGNYSSFFSIWDRVFNTINLPYKEYIKKKTDLCKKYDINKEKLELEFSDKLNTLKDNYVSDDKTKIIQNLKLD